MSSQTGAQCSLMKKVPSKEELADPFQQHRDAWRRLSEELSNYREKLVPELESILSAKTLTSAPAEETTDLEKLDACVSGCGLWKYAKKGVSPW